MDIKSVRGGPAVLDSPVMNQETKRDTAGEEAGSLYHSFANAFSRLRLLVTGEQFVEVCPDTKISSSDRSAESKDY